MSINNTVIYTATPGVAGVYLVNYTLRFQGASNGSTVINTIETWITTSPQVGSIQYGNFSAYYSPSVAFGTTKIICTTGTAIFTFTNTSTFSINLFLDSTGTPPYLAESNSGYSYMRIA